MLMVYCTRLLEAESTNAILLNSDVNKLGLYLRYKYMAGWLRRRQFLQSSSSNVMDTF